MLGAPIVRLIGEPPNGLRRGRISPKPSHVQAACSNQSESFRGTIYSLFDDIEEKPGMFLGGKSLTALRHFVSGFEWGTYQMQHSSWQNGQERAYSEFLAWCQHHKRMSGGWFSSLSSEVEDEEAKFDRFYRLLKEYRSKKPKLRYKLTITKRHRSFSEARNCASDVSKFEFVRYDREKCVFLRANNVGKTNWYLYAVFDSMRDVPTWLKSCFGMERQEWLQKRKVVGVNNS